MKDMKRSVGWQRARRPIQFVFMSFMVFMVSIALGAQKPAPQGQAPVFKTKVDVVQLDVSVLDKHRQPVRGLTEKDFTILEDGKSQHIVGFSTFDFDDEAPPATGWMRDVPPDVTTNELKESRLFIIVMDDALIPQEPFSVKSSREIANSIIDKLGPDDLTAVVFTGDNRKTQDFTSDKTKLRAAIEKFNPGLSSYFFGRDIFGKVGVDTDLWFYQSAVRTLGNIADYLIAVPNRRKAVFWVSPGAPVGACATVTGNPKEPPPPPPTCQLPSYDITDLIHRTYDVFLRAQQANVTFYPIDPTGLGGLRGYLTLRIGETAAIWNGNIMQDYLVAAAANTGGRVVMNTNDFEPGITAVFEENKSYYLIGFEPTNGVADGTLRRIEVKVNRPDVEVRSRSSYYAPQPEKPSKATNAAVSPETEALGKAIGGLLPSAGLPMRVTVAPLAVPGKRLATVAIVLGIQQPVPPTAALGRITESTALQISAFTPEGDPRGTQRQTADVIIRAGANGMAAYEVLGRIDLPAGRYRLRMAATNSTSAKTGSVFADVMVPDYSNVPFSASPIVLGATPGRVSAPKDLLGPLLPFVPTAEREFTRSDKVQSLLRLYQSGQKPIDKVAVAIRVRDAADQVKVSEARTIEVKEFTSAREATAAATPGITPPPSQSVAGALAAPATDRFANLALRTADVKYQVPLSTLTPGPYLLSLEATLGSTTIRRDVPFAVK